MMTLFGGGLSREWRGQDVARALANTSLNDNPAKASSPQQTTRKITKGHRNASILLRYSFLVSYTDVKSPELQLRKQISNPLHNKPGMKTQKTSNARSIRGNRESRPKSAKEEMVDK